MQRRVPSRRSIRVLCSILLLMLGTGCATYFASPYQQMAFDSQPAKADVYVNRSKVGTTPCKVSVRRQRSAPSIYLAKTGYADTQVDYVSKPNYWFYANLLFGGYGTTTMLLTDIKDDKSVMYYPRTFLVTLRPLPGTLENAAQQEKEARVVDYVVSNYGQLTAELSQKGGEHVEALLVLLGVPAHQRHAAGRKLLKLSIEENDPPAFGRAVAQAFPGSLSPGMRSP